MRKLTLLILFLPVLLALFAESGSLPAKPLPVNNETGTILPAPVPVTVDRNEPKEAVVKSGDRPPLYDPDIYEPDDTSAEARSINVTSSLQFQNHTIHADGDQDWYRFLGVQGRIYTFYSGGDINDRIYLYADDGVTQLAYNDNDGAGNNFYLEFAPTTTAYYKLKVNTYPLNLGNYSFHYLFGATPDGYEPDDTAAQSRTIYPGTTLTSQDHTLHSATDQDWFEFFAYTGRIYTFESTGTTDTQIYLYAADGTTLLYSDDDGGFEFNFMLQFSPPTTDYYKIKIEPYQGSGGVYVFN